MGVKHVSLNIIFKFRVLVSYKIVQTHTYIYIEANQTNFKHNNKISCQSKDE